MQAMGMTGIAKSQVSRRCVIAVAAHREGRREVLGVTVGSSEAQADALAFRALPNDHRTKLHSTNPLERLDKEVKRGTNAVGIFPNDAAIIRPAGAS